MPETTAEQEACEKKCETCELECADRTKPGALPEKAKEYLAFLEARTGVEVGCISTGPERNQTIVRLGSRLERLIC